MMDLENWNSAILDTVQEFDCSTAPYGLYSVRDLAADPNREKILSPFKDWLEGHTQREEIAPLAAELGRVFQPNRIIDWAKRDDVGLRWNLSDGDDAYLRFIRLAKIKVRKFGSSYHVDKHENFTERWAKCDLDSAISRLWSSPRETATRRAVLFIGFDKALRPFERELSALTPHLTHASHGIVFSNREWLDRHDRGFKIRAALWTI